MAPRSWRRGSWPTRAGSPCARPGVRGRRPAPPARRLRHRRASAARGRPGRLGAGPAQLPLRRGHRRRGAGVRGRRPQPPRRALQQRAAVSLQGALGLVRRGARATGLSARDRGRPPGQRLRGQYRQRPHRRLRQGRRAAALVRHLRPRGGAVRRAGGRRGRRRRRTGGDRLGQRPPRAAQRRRLPRLVVGLARARADDPPQRRGGRLRCGRQRLRPGSQALAHRGLLRVRRGCR